MESPSTFPETEFEARERFLEHFNRDGALRGQVAYSLSFASDSLKSDFESDNASSLLDERMKRQLRESRNALLAPSVDDAQNRRGRPLPRQDPYSLSFANDSLASDFASDNSFPLLDERMKRQLRESYGALLSPSENDAQNLRSRLPPRLDLGRLEASALRERVERKLPPLELERGDEENDASLHARPLPKTVYDIVASKLDEDARAIIVTETKNPFRIVAVNTAWENLCGYSREECKGRSVGRLLQGPETDTSPTKMVGKLLQGEEAEAVAMFTNYTKQGRKFRNNIRVGPIFDEMGKTVNFVGVLHEVEDYEGKLTVGVGGDRGRMQLPFMS